MCFTCYFRFIGVYFLLNNEPEGNGNLNRLKNWSQCHQKLPALHWCSVATLFAYSAGQMCLLQKFWLKSWSHFQQGWDFILWALSVGKCEGGGCPWALQHGRPVHMCYHKAPRVGVTQQCSAHVTLTKAGHFSGASQAQGNLVWVVGNPCDAVGACRGSPHGSHALLVDATPAKMAHVSCGCSWGQVKGKHRNLEDCMVILPPATGSWSVFLNARGHFSFSAATGVWGCLVILPVGVLWRSPAPHDTARTCCSQLWHRGDAASHCFVFPQAGWHPGVWVCLRGFHCNPALWVLTGAPEPSSASTWPLAQPQFGLSGGITPTFLPWLILFPWLIQSFPFGARDREEEMCTYSPKMKITLA